MGNVTSTLEAKAAIIRSQQGKRQKRRDEFMFSDCIKKGSGNPTTSSCSSSCQRTMPNDEELFQNMPKLGLKAIKITDHEDTEDECCTPTSAQNKIPALLICPPAPKKPRRSQGSCKRKQSNLHFFEVMNREEVEMFFRSIKKVGFSSSGVVA
ncbi:unnamed protein product [Dovyalis caffra]|uniref:Uncharacterized protein n=1 Tax=Dovyalis caffra TaxID=77055 RepID=A0AAV1QV62_9ROSI|nr:unnamed protein product [Dovyalis caffra]